MALQGVFNADFSKFTAACADAEASLKGFETGANTTAAALNKMADSVSGQKIVQQAYLATKAVEDVGGAAVLTEKELAKMSAIAAEGAEKLIKMGQTVPADMQRLADATKNTADATGGWASALSTAQGVLGAFGLSASISGLVSFGKSVFDSASAIHDMGERLGISAEAVQGFKFAAEQAGSSLDTVGTAITKMNQHLAEGDKNTVEALHQAGLEFSTIRNMKPEDAFLAITDAIAEIPDPMDRSRVALELFGKGAAELLPAITEGFRAASDGAQKMSEGTIAALERAQDAWERLGNSVTIISGTMIAGVIDTTTHMTSSWGNFWQFVKDAASMGGGAAAALATMNEQIKDTVAFSGPLETGMHKTKEETEGAAAAAKKYAAELAALGKEHAATMAAIEKIEGDHTKAAETNYLGLSKLQNDQMGERLANMGKASDQMTALEQRLTDEYKRQSMDRSTYENLKLWESAEAQIAAFQKTGASAEQVTQFSNKLYEETAIKAGQIQYTATAALENITQTGIDEMNKLLAAQQTTVAQAAQTMQTYQGGTSLPGSSYATDFGQKYLISPTGSKVPLGPHGELPRNWDDMYSGKTNFPQFAGGVNNFSGGLAIVGERGPELVNLPGGSDVIPNGRGGGVTQIFNISHPLGTPEAIARAVAEAQVGLLRNQGVRLPYGT